MPNEDREQAKRKKDRPRVLAPGFGRRKHIEANVQCRLLARTRLGHDPDGCQTEARTGKGNPSGIETRMLPGFGRKGECGRRGILIRWANLDHDAQVAAHRPGPGIAHENTEKAIPHPKRRWKCDDIDPVRTREPRSKRNPHIGPDPKTRAQDEGEDEERPPPSESHPGLASRTRFSPGTALR